MYFGTPNLSAKKVNIQRFPFVRFQIAHFPSVAHQGKPVCTNTTSIRSFYLSAQVF